MTRTSFAGVLRRAMRSYDPPLTPLDVSLLCGTIAEESVRELLDGTRRPSLLELTTIAEALELPMEELLANQRLAGGGGDE